MGEQVKVVCTKEVVMSEDSQKNPGKIAFAEGKIYEGESKGFGDIMFIDELGEHHYISDDFFIKHFENYKEPTHAVIILMLEKNYTEEAIDRRQKDKELYEKELSLVEDDLKHNLERLADIEDALKKLK